jgi:hypothetical protein
MSRFLTCAIKKTRLIFLLMVQDTSLGNPLTLVIWALRLPSSRPLYSVPQTFLSAPPLFPRCSHHVPSPQLPQAEVSSGTFEEELGGAQGLEEIFKMSRPSDPTAAAEADRLDDLQDRIEIKLDRMKPNRVKLETVKMMEKQMEEVQELTMKYGFGSSHSSGRTHPWRRISRRC